MSAISLINLHDSTEYAYYLSMLNFQKKLFQWLQKFLCTALS